jgi:hypothetical protein
MFRAASFSLPNSAIIQLFYRFSSSVSAPPLRLIAFRDFFRFLAIAIFSQIIISLSVCRHMIAAFEQKLRRYAIAAITPT